MTDKYSLLSDFAKLSVKHILTTNYDYNLEKTVNPKFNRKKSPEKTRKKITSLDRKLMPDGQITKQASKVVWHIHGEIGVPESICLGFEQYCAHLSAMRQLLTKPCQPEIVKHYPHKPCPISSLNSQMPYLDCFIKNDCLEQPHSWLTLFFTHNIYIVGLTLSFMEIDLWWLLVYRHQYQLKHQDSPHYKNKIVYFHPKGKEGEKFSGELKMMEALGVEEGDSKCLNSGDADCSDFYKQVLDECRGDLQQF